MLHCPYIPLFRLPRRQLYLFRALFRHHRTDFHIPPIYRTDGGKQSPGSNPFLRHPPFVQIEIEFRVIILPPGEIGTDGHFPDTAVGQQLFFQLFRLCIQLVIIVPVHFHPKRARILTHVVTESLVLQSVDAPVAAAQLKSLTYHIRFQCIGKTAFLVFFREINMDGCPAGTLYRGLKLPDFLKSAQIGFHLLNQCIHLFQCTSIRQIGIGVEHHLFIAGKVTPFVYLLHKQS